MNKLENKRYTLEEILDSDDELPTEYIDIPFVPAYQNAKRFEFIEEQKNKHAKSLMKTEKSVHSNGQQNHIKPPQIKSSVLILGYLNKKDKFCFQCFVPTTSKDMQRWFFNYLMFKDLQSDYKFLTTCLVPNYDMNYVNSVDCNEIHYRIKF